MCRDFLIPPLSHCSRRFFFFLFGPRSAGLSFFPWRRSCWGGGSSSKGFPLPFPPPSQEDWRTFSLNRGGFNFSFSPWDQPSLFSFSLLAGTFFRRARWRYLPPLYKRKWIFPPPGVRGSNFSAEADPSWLCPFQTGSPPPPPRKVFFWGPHKSEITFPLTHAEAVPSGLTWALPFFWEARRIPFSFFMNPPPLGTAATHSLWRLEDFSGRAALLFFFFPRGTRARRPLPLSSQNAFFFLFLLFMPGACSPLLSEKGAPTADSFFSPCFPQSGYFPFFARGPLFPGGRPVPRHLQPRPFFLFRDRAGWMAERLVKRAVGAAANPRRAFATPCLGPAPARFFQPTAKQLA